MSLEKNFISEIEQHKGIIIKVVSLYADHPDDRADLKQEILFQAWKSFKRFRGESKFSTWLYKVALNTAMTFVKSAIRHKSNLPVDGVDLEDQTSDVESKNQLYWAIKQLPEIEKTIITLHLDGFDNTEIAEMIGVNRNNLNVKLHRIKQRLLTHLKQEAHGLA